MHTILLCLRTLQALLKSKLNNLDFERELAIYRENKIQTYKNKDLKQNLISKTTAKMSFGRDINLPASGIRQPPPIKD